MIFHRFLLFGSLPVLFLVMCIECTLILLLLWWWWSMMMMMKYIKDKQNTILSLDFCIGHTQWNQAAVCVWMCLSSVKMVHNSDRAVYSIVINFSTEFFVWILCDTHTQFRNGCTIPMNNFPTKYFVSRSDVRTRRITTSVHTNLAHG